MTSKAATNAAGLSAREVDILCAMCQSLKSKPETDMEKFATLAGFTTKASAKSNLYKVLKKVMGKDAAASPEAGKKEGGRKRKAAVMESDGEDGAEETPSKQKQTNKSAGTETGSADGDEDTSSVKEEALGDDADGTNRELALESGGHHLVTKIETRCQC